MISETVAGLLSAIATSIIHYLIRWRKTKSEEKIDLKKAEDDFDLAARKQMAEEYMGLINTAKTIIAELQTSIADQGKDIEKIRQDYLDCQCESAKLRADIQILEARMIDLQQKIDELKK